ncbi:HAD hydrolase-like protein [Austwickia sp. TVS 96-490-7B]|uniref:HAD hydrolase-like protein n=1 Tax=Austwickia sp. TVS 96-490-7B TaxID=2830843 RepID=UPI001C56808E|nr:HAD hydrolase-like protein [Austwickia sp. TVS 96-490-7B]
MLSHTPVPVTAVLFDLDGTISDSGAVITSTLDEVLTSRGWPGLAANQTRQVVGPPLGVTLRDLVGVPEPEIPEVVTQYRSLLRSRLASTPPYDGMLDVIRDLHREGMPLAVATSKVEWMAQEVIASYGVSDCFVAVCGSPQDETTGSKDAVVGAALSALIQAEVDISAAVMVGDRHHDITGAAAHDLPTIAVSWGYGEPAEWGDAVAVVDDPEELLQQLQAGVRRRP